jgi:FkbM family methyltransferase
LLQQASVLGRQYLGSGLGAAKVVHVLSHFFPAWRECPVVGPDGLELRIDIRNGTFGTVVTGYGIGEINPVAHFLDKSCVALDVGANVGYWARLFALKAGKVFAFEPSPYLAGLLTYNCSQVPNITFEKLAVGDYVGETYFATKIASSVGYLASASDIDACKVLVTTLDDWCGKNKLQRIDLVKVDVEGFEEEVLVGAATTVDTFKPVLVLEFIDHLAATRSKHKGGRFFQILAEYGYEVFRIDKSGLAHADLRGDADWTNDYLALHPASRHFAALKALTV